MSVQADPSGDAVSELVKLAQRSLRGESALSAEAGFARLQARLAEPPPPRRWFAGLGLLGSAAVLSAVLLWLSRPADITYEVVGKSAALANDGQINGPSGTQLRFSDGSEITLAENAQTRITDLSEHGGNLKLAGGALQVKIKKRPRAAWTVEAGPYQVHVTGTAFKVSWSDQTQELDVQMHSGSVLVTGPMAGAGVPVSSGQHLVGRAGRLSVDGRSPSSAEVVTESAGPSSVEAHDNAAPALPNPSHSAALPSRPGTEALGWSRAVAQGHFAEVLAQAEQRGLDRTLASGTLEELTALADAARYAKRVSLAERVLLAERQRFTASGAARDAAFFLGRLGEGKGSGALEWYEKYLSESPSGPYASQAFGRKMMLLYEQRGVTAARPIAAEYLSRYPNGPYAAAARKIGQELSPAAQP